MPTEAKWEYAARRGGGSPSDPDYTGSDTIDDVAWYGNNSGSKTREVGKKLPNSLGLHDMYNNVWEWCWDWNETYPGEAQTAPAGASSGSDRVLRGGSWSNPAEYVRSTYRPSDTPFYRNIHLGFRVVRPQF